MANPSQPRPWFRLGSVVARPIQPSGPPPSPAPAPASRPAMTPLPRVPPTMIRPPFRPSVATPLPQAPNSAPPSQPPQPPPTQGASRQSPPIRNSPRASPSAQKSPLPPPSVARKSPLTSPRTQISPPNPTRESPITRKSPLESRVAEKYPSPPKPETHSPQHSPIKQVVSPTMPKLVKRLPESPNTKTALRSPPPFSLPPSQFHPNGDYERDIPTIPDQKTPNKPRSFPKPHRDTPKSSSPGKTDKSKEREEKKRSTNPPQETGMRAITISGKNKGAVMELGQSSKADSNNPHKLRNEGKPSHNAREKASMPMHTFMNNNVQAVNSSVVFNSSLSHHDPGIHLRISRKPVKEDRLNDPPNEQYLYSDWNN